MLPWRDVLHAGPVPDVERSELLQVRASFLAGCGQGDSQALLAWLEQRDRAFLDAVTNGGGVVLWFEHDLYDQLQLLDVLALAREHEATLQAIVVGEFPGKPRFRGLGELTAAELESLWPLRRPADAETLRTAADVWSAFRAGEPAALAERAGRDLHGLPYLAPALLRLLAELPAPVDGLSATERNALRVIADGATTPQAAFLAAQELEEAPFLGDTWFFRELAALGRGDARLVEARDGESLCLTRNGERVLAGELDRAELVELDRWVGGTHVTAGSSWRWDPAARTLHRPA